MHKARLFDTTPNRNNSKNSNNNDNNDNIKNNKVLAHLTDDVQSTWYSINACEENRPAAPRAPIDKRLASE